MIEKLVRQLDKDPKFLKTVGRKVANIHRHDHVRASGESRGYDVAVSFSHLGWHNGKVPPPVGDQSVGKGCLHGLPPAAELLLAVRESTDQAFVDLIEDRFAPTRPQ